MEESDTRDSGCWDKKDQDADQKCDGRNGMETFFTCSDKIDSQ